ncbi:hypothetical protein GCM10010156_12250 [Planobispora rosea]|uniref:Uncharacterized protein n=1 Tax=Planobispora rosea TaxID=35762 RepID=A0A8J3RTP8_PLARO|nr:hypothetical protein [Planobispora rosea]GGS55015.1 hypothetical protein GCM10010156_12250 [Planobispora rosea]GIH82826.1 hypothetical protein Pro02_12340 [Planobispora rosea]
MESTSSARDTTASPDRGCRTRIAGGSDPAVRDSAGRTGPGAPAVLAACASARPPRDTGRCTVCSGVLPAIDAGGYTASRALLIVRHGYCRCPNFDHDYERYARQAPHGEGYLPV